MSTKPNNTKIILCVRIGPKYGTKTNIFFIAFFDEFSELETFSFFFRNVWFKLLVYHPPPGGRGISPFTANRTPGYHLFSNFRSQFITLFFISEVISPGGGWYTNNLNHTLGKKKKKFQNHSIRQKMK